MAERQGALCDFLTENSAPPCSLPAGRRLRRHRASGPQSALWPRRQKRASACTLPGQAWKSQGSQQGPHVSKRRKGQRQEAQAAASSVHGQAQGQSKNLHERRRLCRHAARGREGRRRPLPLGAVQAKDNVHLRGGEGDARGKGTEWVRPAAAIRQTALAWGVKRTIACCTVMSKCKPSSLRSKAPGQARARGAEQWAERLFKQGG